MTGKRKTFWKRPVFFIPAIIVAIPALWLAWWLGSPLFIDKTVIETFPTVTTTTAPDETAAPAEPPTPTTMAPVDREPATDAQPAAAPEPPSTTAPTGETETEPEPMPTTTTEAPGPVTLLSGQFKDADSRHRGSGDATIYELADGSRVLRVENLDVTNGPDLHVYLTPVADATTSGEATAEGYLDLGGLKGNKGDQNYPILGDFDPDQDWTVVIYCVPFHVVFTTAPLS